jgi:purine-binding chemotaxis protein CheW
MRGLSFIVDGELFAADVNGVQKIARKMMVTPVPAAPDAIIGLMNLKGRVFTIFCLKELLGRKKNYSGEYTIDAINVIVFKSFSGSEDQMGLSIDKPGDIIDIDDDIICPPSPAAGVQESFCISGIAELGERLYKIVDIDSIINTYKKSTWRN